MIKQLLKGRYTGVLFFSLVFSPAVFSQDGLKLDAISGNVWMISGGGYANVSMLLGEDRALLVDSKRADHGEEIRKWARILSGGDVAFLINGHVHPDHTDGNAGFGEAGAVIIAHEEVSRVLMAGQRGGPPAPAAALPVMTVADEGKLTLHFDGETVNVIHVAPAHSLGNVMVQYENANVIHMGDLFSPERYPVIAGGTVDGFIAANQAALALADRNTRFIPGNGIDTGSEGVQAYLDMVMTVKARVEDMIGDGMSEEEVLAANPTAEFDATWGDPGRFLPALYRNLAE